MRFGRAAGLLALSLFGCASPAPAPEIRLPERVETSPQKPESEPVPAPIQKSEAVPPAATEKNEAEAAGRRLSSEDFAALFPGKDIPLAEVDGEPILASQLSIPLFFHFSREARDLLRKLVDDTLVRRESARLGITVPESELESGVREAIGTVRRQIEIDFKGQKTLEEFLEKELMIPLLAYQRAQRRFILARLLLERVIRYDQVLEDRVLCRVITVRELAKAEEVLSKLREGADFEALAKQESVAPNREQGGRLPPFGRGYEHPIASVAFDMEQGALGGPVSEKREGETLFHILRVIQKMPGRALPFSEAEKEIVRDLSEKPVEAWEYFYWIRKMEKRYGVRYFEPP